MNNSDINIKYETETIELIKDRIGISEEEYLEEKLNVLNFLNINPDSVPCSMSYLSDSIEKVKDKIRLGEEITIQDLEDIEKEALILWV